MNDNLKEKTPLTIHSVAKAFEFVNMIKEARRPMSLSEIAKLSGYPKSTVYSILSTMKKYDYIQQKDNGKYFLGVGFFECGCVVSDSWDISSIARPHMRKLAAQTKSTSSLCHVGGNSVINMMHVAGGNDFQISIPRGMRLPIHATAVGKLLLASYDNDKVRSILAKLGMTAFTPHTITDAERLIKELDVIRDQKFATDNGEYKIGLRTISAPIYDSSGNLTHTISIMNLFRDTGEIFTRNIEFVTEAAAAITDELT